MDIPEADYRRIAGQITSATSPVGIDAEKTHVLILHRLEEIEGRLAALERRLSAPAGATQTEEGTDEA